MADDRAADVEAANASVDAARDLFLEAVTFARQGKWAQARDSYARSLALRPSPDTLYSLGVAQQYTGQWIEARTTFAAFLREPESEVTAPYRAHAQAAMAELERRVGRIRLDVRGGEPPLEVLINREPWAHHEGGEMLVNPGTHVLSVSAAGYQRVGRAIHVAEGESRAIEVQLTPLQSADAETPDPSSGWGTQEYAGLGLVIAGGAVLAAGITTGLVGVERAADADSATEGDSARTLGITGDALAVTGGLAVGVGLVLLLLGDGEEEPPNRVAVALFDANTAGVRLHF